MMKSEGTERLAETGEETFRLFRRILEVDRLDERAKPALQAEADRFELWAVNLGLFVSGHGSLDYRVRDADNLRYTLRRFMISLNDALADGLEYFADEPPSSLAGTEGDPGSVEVDLESWDDDGSFQTSSSDIEAVIEGVKDPIDRLYKLSLFIRNPSNRSVAPKAQAYRQVDEETGVDLLHVFGDFDYDYVSSVFLQYQKEKAVQEQPIVQTAQPRGGDGENDDEKDDEVWEPMRSVLIKYRNDISQGAESLLVQRLAQANSSRRRQFAYWRRHRLKLGHHTNAFARTQAPVIPARPQPQPQPQSLVGSQDRGLALPVAIPPLSITTASRLEVPQPILGPDNLSSVSVSEYAPSDWQPTMAGVVFPPPPKHLQNGKFFECPYCFTLCSSALLAKKAWRAHIIHDLRPYICTYEQCKNSSQLYDTRADWIQHENSSHRAKVFRCPDHSDQTFSHREEYREHMRDIHATDDDQLAAALIARASEDTLVAPDRCCPICSLPLPTAMQLQGHIALHLERFSMFSLPRWVWEDDDDKEETGSNAVNAPDDESRDGDFDGEWENAIDEDAVATEETGRPTGDLDSDELESNPAKNIHSAFDYDLIRRLQTKDSVSFFERRQDQDTTLIGKSVAAMRSSGFRPASLNPLPIHPRRLFTRNAEKEDAQIRQIQEMEDRVQTLWTVSEFEEAKIQCAKILQRLQAGVDIGQIDIELYKFNYGFVCLFSGDWEEGARIFRDIINEYGGDEERSIKNYPYELLSLFEGGVCEGLRRVGSDKRADRLSWSVQTVLESQKQWLSTCIDRIIFLFREQENKIPLFKENEVMWAETQQLCQDLEKIWHGSDVAIVVLRTLAVIHEENGELEKTCQFLRDIYDLCLTLRTPVDDILLSGADLVAALVLVGRMQEGAENYELVLESVESASRVPPTFASIFSIRSMLEQGLQWTAREGIEDLCEAFLLQGAHPETIDDVYQQTPLHEAAAGGNYRIVALLLSKGVSTNRQDLYGLTPLHQAVKSNRPVVVEMLLDHGADIESADSSGQTPLFSASYVGLLDIVQLLLKKGARVDAADSNGATPLMGAAKRGYPVIIFNLLHNSASVDLADERGQKPLHYCAIGGHADIAELLVTTGAKVDAKESNGETPLMIAASLGHQELACKLLELGSQIDMRDVKGQSPLHFAAIRGQEEMVKLLLSKGAYPNAVSDEFMTPLGIAAAYNYEGIASELLERGASVDTVNGYGQTALHVAESRGYDGIVRLIRAKMSEQVAP